MVSLIPGTHFYVPPVPNRDDTYTLTCVACGEAFTRTAILLAYDLVEEHWVQEHGDLIR